MTKLFDHAFDSAISLGANCRCAKYLRMMKLRDCSSPFDWVKGSTFEKRIDLICSGFSDYLRPDNLVSDDCLVSPDAGENSRRVDDVSSGFVFLHDFPRGMSVEEGYPQVRTKYDRRIARLLRRLHDGGSHCLVWWSHDEKLSDAALVGALRRLDQVFPARLSILAVEDGPTASPAVKAVGGDGRIVRVSASLVASQDDMNGNRRAIRRLFAALPVKGAALARLDWSVRRATVNLLVCYVPFGGLRKRLRERLRGAFLKEHERV